MSVTVLVPFKSFRDGKSRLATMLSPMERQQLCANMLRRTLQLADEFDNAIVVSNDDDVGIFIRGIGSAARHLAAPVRSDLNQALRFGCLAVARGSAVLVLPTDLVCLDSATLRAFAAVPESVGIAPDRREDGTNLLLIPAQAVHRFRFLFGRGSFARHVAYAESLGLHVRVYRAEKAEFDLDEPNDLSALGKGVPTGASRESLSQLYAFPAKAINEP